MHGIRSIEVVPPKISKVSEQLQELRKISDLLDFITVTDNARGKATINSIAYAHILKNDLNIPVIPHISPRDRNILALKSDVYAGLVLDLDGFFVIGGDSLTDLKEVREVDTLTLISMIKDLAITYSSTKKAVGTSIFHSYTHEYILKKLEHGSDFFITQGILELNQNISTILNEFGNLTVAGFILPKYRAFLENYKRLGLDISEQNVKRFLDAENFESEMIKSALEIYEEIKNKIIGIHIMPLNHFKVAKTLLEVL
jgi:homocysteine S-methyltransferase